MPDANSKAAETLTRNRSQTDDSLQNERGVTDEVITTHLEHASDQALDRQRSRIDEEVERSREILDERLRASAETLPEVVETLAEAAESLNEVAGTLSEAAHTLKDPPALTGKPGRSAADGVASVLEDIADSLAEAAGSEVDAEGPDPSADAPKVVARMADVAGSLSDVAAKVAEERELADVSMLEERALLDRLLEKERTESDETVDFERRERRTLLAAARHRTDQRLARERHDTDEAVRHSFELLEREQRARAHAEDRILTRDELLAIVSHDLRSPLDVIVINAALLGGNAPAGELRERHVRWARNIERAAAAMDRLLADLLDVARFDGGDFQIVATRQDAARLVRDGVEMFASLASQQGLRLEADLPAAAVPAVYDHDRMIQVLSNLLRNAIQFTQAGGSVLVSLTPLVGGCRIAVSDTGRGIAEGQLTRIFERFHRVNAADRRGLGLGLYISKRIVDAHRGDIWAESQVGRGSTFYVKLPNS